MTQSKSIIGIIGGSGLDDPQILSKSRQKEIDTPYGKPSSMLTEGEIKGKRVVILARHGRQHSVPPTLVPYRANIWALKEMGCTNILATTACGSLREEMKPGDLVFIDQFIDFTKLRKLTFFEDKVIHTPMALPFDLVLRKALVKTAKELSLNCHSKGTMITIEGPRFSTKAESMMFRSWGADLINMSTVPEVVLANELQIPYQSVAMVTDYDCWKENEESVSFELIMKRMNENAEKVKTLLIKTIEVL
ncbi:MAG: S-methyl-5'-thioadenosine phosphorylase [Candidatus Shapirobacteria bacterium]|nr:S-methyl-5'-thioadenosine phosphorylase [Candidatus Shapirobacteria bacterium]